MANESEHMLAWYDRHRRDLPWRAPPGIKPDPYAVWLSEIMLQQTTVQAVKPYYANFLALWPTVADLAAAPVDDVMKAWAGLGYYSRARNLHACAKAVVAAHGGQFPASEAGLRSLPGIGPYTAAAVAAIAFDQRAVVVDGNIERVVMRLFAVDTPLPAAKPEIRRLTDILTPIQRAGDFAQSLMDLGATICTPKRPACGLCPIHADCAARKTATQELYPRKAPKAARPLRTGAAFFAQRADGKVLVRTRPPKGLLGGMTEIPGTHWQAGVHLASWSPTLAPLPAPWLALPGHVDHGFTHFELHVRVYRADLPVHTLEPEGCRWVDAASLDSEALPTIMRKIVAHARGTP